VLSDAPTCYCGTTPDVDSATHEHDAFDGIQEVRVNAHEERDVRLRPRSHDDDLLALVGTMVAGRILPTDDRRGDSFDGGTILDDPFSNCIRIDGRESLHATEPIGTVDSRIVPRRPEEWRRRAAVHLDVGRCRECMQAPRSVYLGVLDSGVSVYL
jgi:hypothetical protein